MLEIENVSVEELEAIQELKRRTINDLTPKLLEDETLFYRFLKARDFNIKNAESMIRQHLLDRKQYRIEEILKEYTPSEQILKYAANSFVAFDKDGAAVRYIDIGGLDHKGFVGLYDFNQCVQFVLYNLENDIERMKIQGKKIGKTSTNMIYILNMEKLNLFQVTFKKGLEMAFEGFRLYQISYPERVKSIYIINAAFYFNMGFSLYKNILPGTLLRKIKIFGNAGWQEALLNIIDADDLPAFLGGNRTDPDGNPLCLSFISHGKKIPKELYAKKNKKSIKHEIGVKKLVIRRSSSNEIEFNIIESDTQLEWEYETKNRDIAFGLYYKDNSKTNSKKEELIPKQRIETIISSEVGMYRCDKIGTYLILFDNSYSWWHSKEIYYRIRTTRPKEYCTQTSLRS